MDPPPPPLRRSINTSGSFESTGISENTGEPELSYIKHGPLSVEIEDLQAKEFAINYNSPLTNLGDPVLVQILPFNQPTFCVPIGVVISSSGEGLLDL